LALKPHLLLHAGLNRRFQGVPLYRTFLGPTTELSGDNFWRPLERIVINRFFYIFISSPYLRYCILSLSDILFSLR
jgi:hypothetical protein